MNDMNNTISAIRETNILVRFHGGYYNWKRRDRSAEREYAGIKGINANAGEYRKNLFAGTDALLNNAKALITEARAYHYNLTLPSPYEGENFLRNVMIQRYREGMIRFQHKLDALNTNLRIEWPTMKASAKNALGPLYNDTDYPDLDFVCASNYITTKFKPIPAGENIILDGVDAEIRNEIRAAVDNEMTTAFKAANVAAWKRLMDVIENAKSNLAKQKGDGRFRTEWHDNLYALLDIMDGLNITQDADLADFSEQAHKLLTYSPDVLNDHPHKRDELLKVADKIHSDMSTIFASFGA